jgi:hypothetical protein
VFKLGVYRLEQLQQPQSILAKNRISLHLLREPASPDQARLFECVMPQIRLSSGVYRTTSRARFAGFDKFVNAVLGRQFGSSRELDVHDWAASDCIASAEWALSLRSCFPNARVTASDLTLFLLEAALPGGEAFIFETTGELLQYVRPPFVIRYNPPEHQLMLVNRFLASRGRRRFLRAQGRWTIPQQWLGSDGSDTLDLAPFVIAKIPLIHPDALRQRSDRFAIIRHSAFEALEQPCDVIRAMNIFNLKYFQEARLVEGSAAVRQSLAPGGIWIVGRTVSEDPPVHHATIFEKHGDGFRVIERYGKGSEIEPLILKGALEPRQ